MPLRVSEIRVPIDRSDEEAIDRAMKIAGLYPDDVIAIEIARESVDRRRRPPLRVFTFDFHLRSSPHGKTRPRQDRRVRFVEPVVLAPPIPGEERLDHRPIVIGAGPGGLFAALVLARAGFRPVVIERGSRMNERVRHIERFHRKGDLLPESNYLFGEGGAGTFSDGKLTSRSKDPRARLVLEEFRVKSGMPSVGYHYRPHLGSDRVRAVVGRLRREIEELGGELRYGVQVTGLQRRHGVLTSLETTEGPVPARVAIAAPGHSARDFYRALAVSGIPLEQKPFQMGFRIEHPQEFVDERTYGRRGAEGLPPADYRLAAHVAGASVFSFCMCPGGEIIPAVHDARHFNTNGMSYFRRDTGFANSGFVVTVEPAAFGATGVLAGIELQERYEFLAAEVAGPGLELPAQRLPDFMAGRPSETVPPTSCRSGARPSDVASFAPPWVVEAVRAASLVFDGQMPGFIGAEALICGPEARSSSPVRILRDPDTFSSPGCDGFLPIGEGAGYAGGIVSAAVDGWKAAERVVARFAPGED